MGGGVYLRVLVLVCHIIDTFHLYDITDIMPGKFGFARY